jgi:hypothetical protein
MDSAEKSVVNRMFLKLVTGRVTAAEADMMNLLVSFTYRIDAAERPHSDRNHTKL